MSRGWRVWRVLQHRRLISEKRKKAVSLDCQELNEKKVAEEDPGSKWHCAHLDGVSLFLEECRDVILHALQIIDLQAGKCWARNKGKQIRGRRPKQVQEVGQKR